jgi:phenylalanyl-tRNA synthetase beta subunit
VAGRAPVDPAAFDFDPARVASLTGLALDDDRIAGILTRLGFEVGARTVEVAGTCAGCRT